MTHKISSFALHGTAKVMLVGLIALFGFAAAVLAFVGFVPTGQGGMNTRYDSLTDDITQELVLAVLLGVSHSTARFIIYGVGTALCALAAVFFFQLYRIVRSAERGDPFTAANARRLAIMGWILFVPTTVAIAEVIVRSVPPHASKIMNLGVAVVAGLALLVVAGVFRRGEAMREDLEGTV